MKEEEEPNTETSYDNFIEKMKYIHTWIDLQKKYNYLEDYKTHIVNVDDIKLPSPEVQRYNEIKEMLDNE